MGLGTHADTLNRRLWVLLGVLFAGGCESPVPQDAGDGGVSIALSREALLNPETCKGCHADHYRQWASSMHAYAAEDPVFVAMNRRGQRETEGALGDFCVKCHAPMALQEGATVDGTNLDEVPASLKGVTCYFCHNVTDVQGSHNNPLLLANDTTMRGGIADPVESGVHGAGYSALHDSQSAEAAKLCGSCHDVVNQHGVHLERTYEEWSQSLFSRGGVDGAGKQTCGACHMPSYRGVAAAGAVMPLPERTLHEHLWPGVDVALTDFPDKDVQLAAIGCALSSAVSVRICPSPGGEFEIALEADTAHGFPSGSAQHRRAWLEVVAYDEADNIIFESGAVDPASFVEGPEGKPDAAHPCNTELWLMRDYAYDAQGVETHMFWDAAPSEAHPDGYESCTLPIARTPNVPHEQRRLFRIAPQPSRIEVRVHLQPIGLDVIDDLIASGDLSPEYRDKLVSHTLSGTVTTWRAGDGYNACASTPKANPQVCPDDYRCKLSPERPECQK